MTSTNANPAGGDGGARQISVMQERTETSPNRPIAQGFIGRIKPARGHYVAIDRFGRRVAVAPTIESARDAIVGWYRAAHRGGLLLVEGGAA